MSTAVERKEILDVLENDYRSDLAIHLYSVVLLKRINPYFPRRQWSSWPLSFNDVPIPKTTFLYADSIVRNDAFKHDIDVDNEALMIERGQEDKEIILALSKKKKIRTRQREAGVTSPKKRGGKSSQKNIEQGLSVTDSSEESDPSSDSEDDDSVGWATPSAVIEDERRLVEDNEVNREFDEEQESFVDARSRFTASPPSTQHTQDSYSQSQLNTSVTQDRQTYRQNHNDMISSDSEDEDDKIRAKMSLPLGKLSFIESITNSKSDLVNELGAIIEAKIHQRVSEMREDGEIDSCFETSDRFCENEAVKNMSVQLSEKVDRVFNAVSALIHDHSWRTPLTWQHMLLAATDAEESDPYGEVNVNLLDDVYDHCEDLFENIRYNYEFDEDAEEADVDLESSIITSKGFDVIRYIQSLESYSVGDFVGAFRNYKNLGVIYPQLKYEQDAVRFKLKTIFKNRLRISERTQDLFWGKKRKVDSFSKIPIDDNFTNISDVNEQFLHHGSNVLDAQEYLLEHYR
ncbi:uncharacterized protein RJT20DRAFT_129714 [Scheffersomyces xylosifermentans]|uniref:uncharacterized protein n=1 Tax=Scheffersomyces xylosifermentans TaxID=1304137 RepID=UPI00315CC52B